MRQSKKLRKKIEQKYNRKKNIQNEIRWNEMKGNICVRCGIESFKKARHSIPRHVAPTLPYKGPLYFKRLIAKKYNFVCLLQYLAITQIPSPLEIDFSYRAGKNCVNFGFWQEPPHYYPFCALIILVAITSSATQTQFRTCKGHFNSPLSTWSYR